MISDLYNIKFYSYLYKKIQIQLVVFKIMPFSKCIFHRERSAKVYMIRCVWHNFVMTCNPEIPGRIPTFPTYSFILSFLDTTCRGDISNNSVDIFAKKKLYLLFLSQLYRPRLCYRCKRERDNFKQLKKIYIILTGAPDYVRVCLFCQNF